MSTAHDGLGSRAAILIVVATAAVLVSGCPGGTTTTARSSAVRATATPASSTEYAEIGKELADESTELTVQLALLERLGLDGIRITSRVHGTTVDLGGEVQHADSPQIAEETVRGIDGVDTVVNDIAVVPSPGPTESAGRAAVDAVANQKLVAAVKLALIHAIGRPALSLEVTANDGTVDLSGTVPDEDTHQKALVAAETTTGVIQVDDHLSVG
jgi:osmotically-inducible protein OsmY